MPSWHGAVFSKWLEGKSLTASLSETTKWKILGFKNEEDFENYIYPRIAQLIRKGDAMADDLVQRLVREPAFTPAGLMEEGYRKELAMDTGQCLDQRELGDLDRSIRTRGTRERRAHSRRCTASREAGRRREPL